MASSSSPNTPDSSPRARPPGSGSESSSPSSSAASLVTDPPAVIMAATAAVSVIATDPHDLEDVWTDAPDSTRHAPVSATSSLTALPAEDTSDSSSSSSDSDLPGRESSAAAITKTVLLRKRRLRQQNHGYRSNSAFAVLAPDTDSDSEQPPSDHPQSNDTPIPPARLDAFSKPKSARLRSPKQPTPAAPVKPPPPASPDALKLNIEPANVAEFLLLTAPFFYAVYKHHRDAALYTAIDDFDETYSLVGLDSDALSRLFRLRYSIVFDKSFVLRLLLLLTALFVGLYKEAHALYLWSLASAKAEHATARYRAILAHPLAAVFNSFFPHILYAAILPPLLALATNPQHLAFFHTNLLAVLAYIPFSAPELGLVTQLPLPVTHTLSLRRILCALLEPTLSGVMDHVLGMQDLLALIAQSSLSRVESFLLATLLVNLFYFASFNTLKSAWHNPQAISLPPSDTTKFPELPDPVKVSLFVASAPVVVLKALVFGACVMGVYPALPTVFKIMRTEKNNAGRPLSTEDKTRVKCLQIKDATKALVIYLLTAVTVVLCLFLYVDLPPLHSPASFWGNITYPISFLLSTLLFPSYETAKAHLAIAAYWLAIIAVVIPTVQAKSARWAHVDLRRKVWHITVVAMFLPVGLPSHAAFTKLAMAVATFAFLAVEFLRVTTVPPVGPAVHRALLRYLDPRDTCGPIIVSHIFLLLGISVPVYLCNSPAGIVCLGLGDAAASVFGRRYGRHKWALPRGNKKSVEGTLCFVAAATAGLAAYKYLVLAVLYPAVYDSPAYALDTYNPFVRTGGLTLPKMVLVATLTALLEAFSSLNDNVIVPLYMTALVQLC